jgi:hypothetical protein
MVVAMMMADDSARQRVQTDMVPSPKKCRRPL